MHIIIRLDRTELTNLLLLVLSCPDQLRQDGVRRSGKTSYLWRLAPSCFSLPRRDKSEQAGSRMSKSGQAGTGWVAYGGARPGTNWCAVTFWMHNITDWSTNLRNIMTPVSMNCFWMAFHDLVIVKISRSVIGIAGRLLALSSGTAALNADMWMTDPTTSLGRLFRRFHPVAGPSKALAHATDGVHFRVNVNHDVRQLKQQSLALRFIVVCLG